MFTVNENDQQYRFGDWGPKYLMQGPRAHIGVVVLKSGQDFRTHLHTIREENFYVVEGKIDFTVDDKTVTCGAGELIHVEPNEKHYLKNNYAEDAKAIFFLAPYAENDKTEV